MDQWVMGQWVKWVTILDGLHGSWVTLYWPMTHYHWQHVPVKVKCKGKGLDTCYSATYMSQTRNQQRFTISEVAADWHDPMPQRIMWPSIARANGQLDPRWS